jgi:hypothetical protein
MLAMKLPLYSGNNSFLLTSLLVACGCLSSQVFAESEKKLDFKLSADAGYIDNFLYQTRNEQGTAFYNLSSALDLEVKNNQSAFNIDGTIDSFIFQDFDDDNHTDFTLKPTYQYKFAQNQRLYMSGLWQNQYAYRGTGLSLGEANALTEGDKKAIKGAGVGFEYGNDDSQGKLNVEVNYNESEFTTRRALTNQLDSEVTHIKSSFDYLLSGKTYLAFDVGYQMIEFPNATLSNRDSLTGLVGVKWQTTVISELSFLVGYQNLEFENNSDADDDAFKWRFDYTWRPSDFTTVHAVSNRKFDESNRLTNSYRLAENYQVDIAHAFTDSFNVFVAVSLNRDRFITPESQQDENYLSSKIVLNYQRSERVNYHLRYQHKALDANYADIDYQYNSLTLGMTIHL